MPKQQRYRFKTEQEFNKEFGSDWDEEIGATWISDMDYLLGKEIPKKYIKKLLTNGIITDFDGHWNTSGDMITPMLDMVINKDGSVKYV